MRNLTRDEMFGLPVIICLVLIVAMRFAMPAGLWLDISDLAVHDTAHGAIPEMTWDRNIVRPFDGSWQVVIRIRQGDGWVTHCSTPTNFRPYLPDSALPVPLRLDWFTDDYECYERMPCGEYDMTATWRVWPGSMLFERTVTRGAKFSVVCP